MLGLISVRVFVGEAIVSALAKALANKNARMPAAAKVLFAQVELKAQSVRYFLSTSLN
jgi:hypothetical protein